jgi:hypothetical protein
LIVDIEHESGPATIRVAGIREVGGSFFQVALLPFDPCLPGKSEGASKLQGKQIEQVCAQDTAVYVKQAQQRFPPQRFAAEYPNVSGP